MVKKQISGILLTVLLIGMLTLAVNIQPVEAEPATIYVDDDNTTGPWDGTQEHPYKNITSGLEHAVAGDTIFVYNGIYNENLVLDRALNLIGESNVETTIDAGASAAYTIDIVASYVNISRFNIRNGVKAIASGCMLLMCAMSLITGFPVFLEHFSFLILTTTLLAAITSRTECAHYGFPLVKIISYHRTL